MEDIIHTDITIKVLQVIGDNLLLDIGPSLLPYIHLSISRLYRFLLGAGYPFILSTMRYGVER